MLQWVLSFISGPIVKGALDAYQKKLEAGNTSERIAADITMREIAVEERERVLAHRLLIAEQGHWATRWVRPLWAAPFVIWTWKVVVWDKVLALGTTDELHGVAGTLVVTIAAAYFGGRTIEKVAAMMRR